MRRIFYLRSIIFVIVCFVIVFPRDIRFEYATSVALRSNRVFMLQAVTANRNLFFNIESSELKKDIELLVIACSGSAEESRRVTKKLLREDDGYFELLR